jgi:uncharacterized repeat protein (TIGR01451 family)
MYSQTKNVVQAIRLGWVSVLLFGQVGLGPMAGATYGDSLPNQVAPENISPPASEPLASRVGEYDTHEASDPTKISKSEEASAEVSWPMAAANPERTSWTSEEVRGTLRPLWYRPIEPYIPPHVQIIAAANTVYVSTAKGLYAFDADTGAQKWVYPTEMPLGNSPTITNGVAYVGGLDNKLHAINATTGQGLWTFGVDAGFDTNPLVISGLVYAGNRNGYMYAIYANEDSRKGQLAWRYPPAGQLPLGPIHFSAAYKNNTIYFASDDAYAYALNATTGSLVWKSQKLPSSGFHSWWPVVDGDVVIFSASRPYRSDTPPQLPENDYTLGEPGLTGSFGPLQANGTRDAAHIFDYLESKPWLRSYYILNATSGQEVTFDFNGNGKPEYAPLLSYGTHSGNRYPAVIGPDSTIYTANHYSSEKYDNGVAGWKLGTSYITTRSSAALTWDEPLGYAIGGNVLYWNQCCDRQTGAFDTRNGEAWLYFSYNLDNLIPGYDAKYMGTSEERAVAVYGGWNGIYGTHGDQNPPVPYKGKIYMHRSNALIAWTTASGSPQALPMANTVAKQDPLKPVDVADLKQKLATEVQKIVDAGHLRPGFGVSGAFAGWARSTAGDNMLDYWHNPLDTILTLTRALPYLSPDMQQELKTYLQNEYAHYSPCQYTSVGWDSGAGREAFDLPPEVMAGMGKGNYPPTAYSTYDFAGWTGPDWKWTPHSLYAMWKYAQVFGGAKNIFDTCRQRLWTPPSDDILAEYPFVHNAWIAGYWGYLELEKMAGYPEEADKRATLNRLLSLRVSNFAKDNPWGPDLGNPNPRNIHQSLSVARNFIFLTPELGQYLHDHAFSKVKAALDEYETVAPYWFVTQFEATYNEMVFQHLYDYNALFAAKAMIFQEPAEELVKYLDVPAFEKGDLFYIQNLVLALDASGIEVAQTLDVTKIASKPTAHQSDVITYTLTVGNAGVVLTQTLPITVMDRLPTGLTHGGGLCASSQGVKPTCSSTGIVWTGELSNTAPVVISYTAQVTTALHIALTNQMRVDAGPYGLYTRTVTIIASPLQAYLPLILKGAGG